MHNVVYSPLIEDLFSVSTKPCLSLYLPPHRTQPERRDDYTRFHQLVREFTNSLKNGFSQAEIDMLMAPFHDIDRDERFWNQRRAGIAKRGFAIANSGGMRRFVGYTTTSDEIELDTQRFYPAVDKILTEEVPMMQDMPLVLAGLSEQAVVFQSISRNPRLVEGFIDVNPLRLTQRDRTQRSWEVMEPYIRQQSNALLEAYDEAAAHNGGIEGVFTIAHAATEGRVQTLFVEDNRQVPGKIDEDTGNVIFDDLAQPYINDVVDDIARVVLQKGGTVIVLPTHYMPTSTGAAAILRY